MEHYSGLTERKGKTSPPGKGESLGEGAISWEGGGVRKKEWQGGEWSKKHRNRNKTAQPLIRWGTS